MVFVVNTENTSETGKWNARMVEKHLIEDISASRGLTFNSFRPQWGAAIMSHLGNLKCPPLTRTNGSLWIYFSHHSEELAILSTEYSSPIRKIPSTSRKLEKLLVSIFFLFFSLVFHSKTRLPGPAPWYEEHMMTYTQPIGNDVESANYPPVIHHKLVKLLLNANPTELYIYVGAQTHQIISFGHFCSFVIITIESTMNELSRRCVAD